MNREPFFTRLAHSVILTVCTLAIIVALVAGGVWLSTQKDKKIEDGSWLVLDLYGEVHEYDTPGGPLGEVMGGGALTLQDLLDNLGKAAIDDRIVGVIFRISSSNTAGWAKLQELRRAVDKVQAAGKPVHAWADALDAQRLYLAAGCDDVLDAHRRLHELQGLAAVALLRARHAGQAGHQAPPAQDQGLQGRRRDGHGHAT